MSAMASSGSWYLARRYGWSGGNRSRARSSSKPNSSVCGSCKARAIRSRLSVAGWRTAPDSNRDRYDLCRPVSAARSFRLRPISRRRSRMRFPSCVSCSMTSTSSLLLSIIRLRLQACNHLTGTSGGLAVIPDVEDKGAFAIWCVVDVEMAGLLEVIDNGRPVELDVTAQPLRQALDAGVDAELVEQLLTEAVAVLVAADVRCFEPGDIVTA